MIIIDSDVAIEIIHGKITKDQIIKLISPEDKIGIVSLSIYEIFFGYFMWSYSKKDKKSKNSLEKELAGINQLKSILIQIPFDDNAAVLSSEIYHQLGSKGQKIDVFDCMIAGTMISRGYKKILTRNTKHFSRISELEVIGLE